MKEVRLSWLEPFVDGRWGSDIDIMKVSKSNMFVDTQQNCRLHPAVNFISFAIINSVEPRLAKSCNRKPMQGKAYFKPRR